MEIRKTQCHSVLLVHGFRSNIQFYARDKKTEVIFDEFSLLVLCHGTCVLLSNGRFTFVVPPVTAPRIQLRAFHPSPSYLSNQEHMASTLRREISPRANCKSTTSIHVRSLYDQDLHIATLCGFRVSVLYCRVIRSSCDSVTYECSIP